MKFLLALYVSMIIFIMVRHITGFNKKSSEYKLKLPQLTSFDEAAIFISKIIYLIFWPVVFCAFPTDSLKAFFLSNKLSLIRLYFILGKLTGYVAASIKAICKNL